MTHINPDGKAVGGPQPEELEPLLHVYSQPVEHFDARIVGNKKGLTILLECLQRALAGDTDTTTSQELFCTDGEGYDVNIRVLPDDSRKQPMVYNVWDEYPPIYTEYLTSSFGPKLRKTRK